MYDLCWNDSESINFSQKLSKCDFNLKKSRLFKVHYENNDI
jgi:hypothetical protein